MRYPHSRFKLRATTLAVITVLGGFTLSGSAAETTLKDTVVSAPLSEHETRTAPASVIVITRQELETRNATDLLDAVRGSLGTTLSPRQVGGTGRTIKLTEAQSLDVQWS
jgi:outer membrane receptor for ferrienterochelin and colicins